MAEEIPRKVEAAHRAIHALRIDREPALGRVGSPHLVDDLRSGRHSIVGYVDVFIAVGAVIPFEVSERNHLNRIVRCKIL